VLGKAQQNVVCIINGMLRKMKTDEQNTPLNELLICSICLTTDKEGGCSSEMNKFNCPFTPERLRTKGCAL